MRFLLYGNVTEEIAAALRELGHAPVTAAEAGIDPAAEPAAVREKARAGQMELVSGDSAFIEAILPGSGRREVFGRVIVYLQVDPARHADAIERLFDRYKRLTPGRVYTVTASRVKVRQLPAGEET